jgi:succinate-acetate transporter protein
MATGNGSEFRNLPVTLQKAFISLGVGWMIHLVIVFLLFHNDQKIVVQNVAIGVFVLVFVVIKKKNWARTLCLIANLLLLLFYLFTTLLMHAGQPEIAALSGLNAGIFAIASWFLMKKETATYYKELMEDDSSDSRK